MAIVQISQIKHRRGTNENLPQLASAELGWSVDTRQLYIGNGTLAEGAPEVGNTEILTQYSDIPGVPASHSQTVSANTTASIASAAFNNTDQGVTINYAIQRASDIRTGYVRISQYLASMAYDEEYTETADIGVTFVVTQVSSSYAQLSATVNNASPYAGISANITFTAANISI